MGAPNIDTEQKREGTAAHWVGESALLDGQPCATYEGQTAPNGVRVDSDMCEAAQVYVDDVRRVLAEYGGALHVELTVSMPSIHPENRGTLDGQVVVYSASRVFIWDFKYGRRRVDARGNLQLIDYAAGVKDLLNIDGHQEQYTRVDIVVVQPRCYKPCGPVDTWSVMLSELRPYWNQLRTKAEEALMNPKFTAGKWCRDCPALVRCDTATMYSYSVYQYADQPYEINTLTDKQATTEYRNMCDAYDVIKARRDALHDDVRHRTSSGKNTGLALDAVQGRAKWAIDDDTVITAFKQLGITASKETPLTPKQMVDRSPAELKATVAGMVKQLSKRNTSTELVPAEDCLTSRIFK